MPMYEYRCDDCQGVTELLRSMSTADDAAACETCGSTKTRRVQSVFAACGSGAPAAGGAGHAHSGGCCPCGKPNAACGMN